MIVLSLVLALAAACSPRGPAPAASPPRPAADRTPAAAPPQRAVVRERAVSLDVPPGFFPFVEFADARHGYALFTECGNGTGRCAARLFATVDGGATWQPRAMPVTEDRNIQMYVLGPRHVTIWTESDGRYHLSRDGGRTFPTAATSVPHEFHAANGLRYGIQWGPTEGVLTDWQTGLPVPLPDGYASGGAAVTGDGAIWLTRLDGDKETARSTDGGRTWDRLPVPEQPGRKLYAMFVRVSPTGDVWLTGDQEPVSSGGGTAVLRGSVLKGTGLPLVWQLVDGGWTPRPIEGLVEKPTHAYSTAPVGDGLLAITGPDGVGYLADRYVEVPGTPRVGWLGSLPDGTLYGASDTPGEFHLSTGTGWTRTWTTTRLTAR